MLPQGSFLFTEVCIFPLSLSSLVRAGDGDNATSSTNNGMDSLPPCNSKRKGNPESMILLFHRKGQYRRSDMEWVLENSSLISTMQALVRNRGQVLMVCSRNDDWRSGSPRPPPTASLQEQSLVFSPTFHRNPTSP